MSESGNEKSVGDLAGQPDEVPVGHKGSFAQRGDGQHRYVWLLTSQLLFVLASYFGIFSLAVWMITSNQSVVGLSILSISAILPAVLVSPIAFAFIDRLPRKPTLILANATVALVSMCILTLSFLNVLQSWHVYLCVVSGALAMGWQQSLFTHLAAIVSPAYRQESRVRVPHTALRVVQFLSPALAGTAMLFVGLTKVLVIVDIAIAISMTALLFVPIAGSTMSHRVTTHSGLYRLERSALDWSYRLSQGWRYVSHRSGLRAIFLLFAVKDIAVAVCALMALPLLLSLTDAARAGLLVSLSGAGFVIGVVFIAFGRPFSREIDNVFLTISLFSASMILAAFTRNIWLLGVVLTMGSVVIPVIHRCGFSLMYSRIPTDVQDGLRAVRRLIRMLFVPVIVMVCAFIVDYFLEPWMSIYGGGSHVIAIQWIGAGDGRGIALMLSLGGILLALSVLLASQYAPLLQWEDSFVGDDIEPEAKRLNRDVLQLRSFAPVRKLKTALDIVSETESPALFSDRFLEHRPWLLSLALFLLVLIWMALPATEDPDAADREAKSVRQRQSVQVADISHEPLVLKLSMKGQTRADATAHVSAELDAILTEFTVERGAGVLEGDPLATLSTGSLTASLSSARAERVRARLNFDTASELTSQGVSTEQEKATAWAVLQGARAREDDIRKEIDKSIIRAPFSGVVADLLAEPGNFVGVGQPVALLISVDPLIAVGKVSERDVDSLNIGDSAIVTLPGNRTLTGLVSYVSPVADEATRSFSVEVSLPNAQSSLPVGTTSNMVIELETVMAHRLSPELLTLNALGDIEVATVDEVGTVAVHAVDIIHSEGDSVWVDGVPDGQRIITRGQGFVREGDRVDPVTVNFTASNSSQL